MGTDKSPQPTRSSASDLLGTKRAYTMGQKVKARQMFVFNEDGTIKGLVDVQPAGTGDQKL